MKKKKNKKQNKENNKYYKNKRERERGRERERYIYIYIYMKHDVSGARVVDSTQSSILRYHTRTLYGSSLPDDLCSLVTPLLTQNTCGWA